ILLSRPVIPAKAGIRRAAVWTAEIWVPAFAGTTMGLIDDKALTRVIAGRGRGFGRFSPGVANYLQVFDTGERRQIDLLPFGQMKSLQPGQPGERREIGDLRAVEIEGLQPAQPGERREIGDLRAVEIE